MAGTGMKVFLLPLSDPFLTATEETVCPHFAQLVFNPLRPTDLSGPTEGGGGGGERRQNAWQGQRRRGISAMWGECLAAGIPVPALL